MRLDGRVTPTSGHWGRPARSPGVAVRVEVVSAEKQDAPRKIADSSGPSERLPLCLLRVDGYREPEAAEAAHEPVGRRRRFLAVEGVGAALVVGRAAGDDVVGDRLAAAISRISAIVSAVTCGGGAARGRDFCRQKRRNPADASGARSPAGRSAAPAARSLDAAPKDQELLAQEGILGDKGGPTAHAVGERARHDGRSGWFRRCSQALPERASKGSPEMGILAEQASQQRGDPHRVRMTKACTRRWRAVEVSRCRSSRPSGARFERISQTAI